MKILVDRNLLEEAFNSISWMANQKHPHKPGDGSDFDKAYLILENMLATNPVEIDGFNSFDNFAVYGPDGNLVTGNEDDISDRQAMIEILDMFIYGYFSGLVVEKASKIKAKLVGEK